MAHLLQSPRLDSTSHCLAAHAISATSCVPLVLSSTSLAVSHRVPTRHAGGRSSSGASAACGLEPQSSCELRLRTSVETCSAACVGCQPRHWDSVRADAPELQVRVVDVDGYHMAARLPDFEQVGGVSAGQCRRQVAFPE